MLTPQEIKKLTDYLVVVFTDIFVTKEDLEVINGRIDILQISMDGLLKHKSAEEQETIILNYRMKNAENWIDKAAPKIGLEFEH